MLFKEAEVVKQYELFEEMIKNLTKEDPLRNDYSPLHIAAITALIDRARARRRRMRRFFN
jgi:hypothetical protein